MQTEPLKSNFDIDEVTEKEQTRKKSVDLRCSEKLDPKKITAIYSRLNKILNASNSSRN